jgi:hypothetical protein
MLPKMLTSFGKSLSFNSKNMVRVSIQEIKKELIKPIENMESKLDVKDRLTDPV